MTGVQTCALPIWPEEGPPGDVADLARRRDKCRRERKFAEADALREKIREAGYEVVDRKGEPGIPKKR